MAFRNAPDFSSKDFINTAIRDMISKRMFFALLISGAVGITLMAALKHYTLMAIFIAVLLLSLGAAMLMFRNIISAETANMIPLLALLFIYTPASWFTFDGLMGCTPYLTILFMVIITLTHYNRFQTPVLTVYTVFIAGLLIYWVANDSKNHLTAEVINILYTYAVSYILIFYFLIKIKNKSLEVSGTLIDESIRDQLTGLYNRRIIDNVITSCEKKYKADKSDYSVMMIDINSFKKINDVFGHAEGDEVLTGVAQSIKQSIRSTDYPIRYGGDEYLLILPGARTEAVMWIYSRIQAHTGELDRLNNPISLSMGHAMRSECASPSEMIKLADSRMYENKYSSGR